MRRFLNAIFPLLICGLVVGCGGGGNDAAPPFLNATTNAAPMASAGSVQNVMVGTAVTLDGSASSDSDRDPLTYAWTLTGKPAGSVASLSSGASAQPAFTADLVGSYVATLVVNDGKDNSSAATVTVSAFVANSPPVAVAKSLVCQWAPHVGPSCSFGASVVAGSGPPNAYVTLDGSGSTDANGDTLTYSWTMTSKPAGSAASINTVNFGFVADVLGTYVATLVVNDGKVNSEAANVVITATTAVAFNSIPWPLPASVLSYGFEAYFLRSLGDRIYLGDAQPRDAMGYLRSPEQPRMLHGITVAMNSEACETGSSGAGSNCASTANSAFDHPITINIYNDSGALLATRTQTFAIPYRPSTDPACAEGRWKASDGGCYNGFAFKIDFDLHALKVRLPDTFVYEVVYSTSTQGPSPLGQPGGYDSLGVGAYSTPASLSHPDVGYARWSDPDVGYVRWNGSLVDKGAGVMAEVRVTF